MYVWELKDVISNTYSNLSYLFIQGDSLFIDIIAEDDFQGPVIKSVHINMYQTLDDWGVMIAWKLEYTVRITEINGTK